MEQRVDINSTGSVELMFEELVRAHQAVEPVPNRLESRAVRTTKPPPRRVSMVPSFWAVGDDSARVSELRILLADPDVLAPVAPTLLGSAPQGEPRTRHAAGWTLSPVAMARSEHPGSAAVPPSVGASLRWLVPATAGAFAVGAVFASEWVNPSRAVMSPASSPPVEGHSLLEPRWGAAEDYSAWTLQLMRRPSLVGQPGRLLQIPDDAPPAAAYPGATRPASAVVYAASRLGPEPARQANLRAVQAASLAAARAANARAAALKQAAPVPVSVADESLGPFDRQAALDALRGAAGAAAGCAPAGSGTQRVPVSITFAPSGRATVAQVGGALAGTAAGSCVARAMRSAQVPPFTGSLVTVTKTVRLK